MRDQSIIFEDFVQDREVKMFIDHEKESYSVYVQVFTTDNLPFSPINGCKEGIFFNYANVTDDKVTFGGVVGDNLNPTTKVYEVTDHTFVVGKMNGKNISENTAIATMKKAANNVISELDKSIPMPKMLNEPHVLTDIQRCEQLLSDRDVRITTLSKATGIPTFALYNYRRNPATLQRASYQRINRLVAKYYETYFNRNEIERFRFMLINIVGAYLGKHENEPTAYNSAFELYEMCQHGDWHRLAKMEEIWKAFYNAQK